MPIFGDWLSDALAGVFTSLNPLSMIDGGVDNLIGLWTPDLNTTGPVFALMMAFTAALGLVIGLWYLIPVIISAMSTGDIAGIARAVVGLGATAAAGPTVMWGASYLRQPIIDTAQSLWGAIATGSILQAVQPALDAPQTTLLNALMLMLAGIVYVIAGFIAAYGYLFIILLAPIAFASLIMKSGVESFLKWLTAFLSLMFAPIWAVLGLGIAGVMADTAPAGLGVLASSLGLLLAAFAPITAIALINKYVPHGGAASDAPKIGAGHGASGAAQSAAIRMGSKAA